MAQSDAQTLHHQSCARRPSTAITVAMVLGLLILARLAIDLHWAIFLGGVLLTTPALYDLYRNPCHGFDLTPTDITLTAPNTDPQHIPLAEIDQVTITTRLDFSARITILLQNGQKLRLHPAQTPPADQLAQVLTQHGVKIQRKHFSFLG